MRRLPVASPTPRGLRNPAACGTAPGWLAEQTHLPKRLQADVPRLAEISRTLRRDRELAFCGAEDLTPSDFHKEPDAVSARDAARFVVGKVRLFVREPTPTSTPMPYLTRRPLPPLDGCIASIWHYRCEPRPFALERVLPTGAAQLIVNLKEDRTRAYDADNAGVCRVTSGAVVSGLGTRFQIIDSAEQEHVLGVSFHPGGTVAFFREPAHALNGPDVPLEALWGVREAARLRETLLEAPTPEAVLAAMERALLGAWRARHAHPAVAFALTAFLRRPDLARVRAVTEAVGMSPRRFIERFKADVGLTPKQYCRVLRFQRAVSQAHACAQVDWTEVALSCGYFDQAHFIHDFRAFSGLTPTGYRAGRTQFQNHVTFLQSPGA